MTKYLDVMKRFIGHSLSLVALLFLAGCHGQTQTSQARGISGPQRQGSNSSVPPVVPNAGPIVHVSSDVLSRGNDVCAAQLQDIADAMLLFQAKKGGLPAKLDDLRPFAIGTTAFALECPLSKQPYIYDPNGPVVGNSVVLSNSDGRSITLGQAVNLGQLMVYDSYPSHDGERWGVIIGMDSHGNTPIATPYRIPEKTFQELLRSGRPAPRQ